MAMRDRITRARSSDRRRAAARPGEEGQGLVEYGLLLGLVATSVMLAVATLGARLLLTYGEIAARVAR
jgi:Flp pilus assembly pilin Flp